MNDYLEYVLERYVIATTDSPTKYLVFKDNRISFTKHISNATKTAGRITANTIRDEFYAFTGRDDIELVVVPVRISYELLREGFESEGDFVELLS